MPIFTEKEKTYDELKKYVQQGYTCADCGASVTLCWGGSFGFECYILRCSKDVGHSKIKEDFKLNPYNTPGYNLFDVNKRRREKMEHKVGQEKTRALAKYQMAGIINRDSATEIVETLWKGASPVDKTKAILLCATYNLNPLMNHLFMLPFKNKNTGKTDYAVVIGIEATRLMAHRKHKFTYLDLTPRKATTDELEKILGKENIKPNTLYVITKGRDLETDAEGYGLGSWSGPVYGEDKGNSAFNMASIRSERQFFKRMYPAEQPAGVDVVDERFVDAIEGEYKEVDTTTGEITEGEAKGKPASEIGATKKKPQAKTAVAEPGTEEKQEASPETPPAVLHPSDGESKADGRGEGNEPLVFDMKELKSDLEKLETAGLKAWTKANVLSYLNVSSGKEHAKISDAFASLSDSQKSDFLGKVKETLKLAGL